MKDDRRQVPATGYQISLQPSILSPSAPALRRDILSFYRWEKRRHKEVTQVLQGTYNLDEKGINFGSVNVKFCLSVKSTVKMLFLNSFSHNPMILLAWSCTTCSERLWPQLGFPGFIAYFLHNSYLTIP